MTEVFAELLPGGRLVIPESICSALGIAPGTRFYVYVEAGKIILEPVSISPVEKLYGKYADVDLLTALEAEHRSECSSQP